MSYRCQSCGRAVAHGQPQLKIVITREVVKSYVTGAKRIETAREVPVCQACHHGVSVDALLAKFSRRPVVDQPAPAEDEAAPIRFGA